MPVTVLVGLHPQDVTKGESDRVLNAEGTVIQQPHQNMHLRGFLLGYLKDLVKLVLRVRLVRPDVLSKGIVNRSASVSPKICQFVSTYLTLLASKCFVMRLRPSP